MPHGSHSIMSFVDHNLVCQMGRSLDGPIVACGAVPPPESALPFAINQLCLLPPPSEPCELSWSLRSTKERQAGGVHRWEQSHHEGSLALCSSRSDSVVSAGTCWTSVLTLCCLHFFSRGEQEPSASAAYTHKNYWQNIHLNAGYVIQLRTFKFHNLYNSCPQPLAL